VHHEGVPIPPTAAAPRQGSTGWSWTSISRC